MKYHYTPTPMAVTIDWPHQAWRRMWRKWNPSSACENVKRYGYSGSLFRSVSKSWTLKYHGTHASTPKHHTKGNDNICPCKDMYVKVHSGVIPNSPKLGTIQMTVSWWTTWWNTAKQQKWTNYCYTVVEPRKHDVKWKKADTKDCIFLIPFIWNF